jgi:phosphonate transport system substrate-binding protein
MGPCVDKPLAAEGADGRTDTANTLFQLAFSTNMFTEVKVEDARAAMKVWMMTIARERHIPIEPDIKVYDGIEQMLIASRNEPVEGFAVTAEECLRLREKIQMDRLVVGVHDGQITEQYVVLVRKEGGIQKIGDLRDRSMTILENPRMSLARVWLDTLLLEEGFQSSAAFLKRTTAVNKLAQVVLPVFFRNSDACLVTSRGFRTMSELNPQVGKQLRVLAASPEVVPTVFVFRCDRVSPHRARMVNEMGRFPDSPAGQQILTLIQADRIIEQPLSCMTGAFDLLAAHQRLRAAKDRTKDVGVGLLPGETRPGGSR